MDTSQLEANLYLRIEQSRDWITTNPQPLTGFKFRKNTDWDALPVKFLDDPERVERHGVRFRFYVVNYTKKIEVELDIRIHPIAEVKEKGDSHPYVVFYVVNQLTGADVEISQQEFTRADSYTDLINLSIEDWYRHWIKKMIRNKKSSKIFHKNMELVSERHGDH